MRCPFLLVHGAGDEQIPLPLAREALRRRRLEAERAESVHREEGGFHHCQVDNVTIGVHYMWDWIAEVLKP